VNLRNHYDWMQGQGAIFSFCGTVSQEAIESIGDMLKIKLTEQGASETEKRKMFAIYIEQMHNILHYSSETDRESGRGAGIFLVGREDGKFFLIGGNHVTAEQAAGLRSHLDSIQGLDRAELKALHKKKLRESPGAESKGAGLGLIEMARTAEGRIEHAFEPAGEDTFFFHLKITL